MLTFRSIWPLFDSLSNRQQQRILAILNLRRFSTALIADSQMIDSINDKFLGCHTVKAHLPINADDHVTRDNLFWGLCPGLLQSPRSYCKIIPFAAMKQWSEIMPPMISSWSFLIP
jgi:hypothetical protein